MRSTLTLAGAAMVAVIGLSHIAGPLLRIPSGLGAHDGHGSATTTPSTASTPLGPQPCINGFAGSYPCARVDLLSFTPLAAMGGGRANDVWGWTDPLTGKEYALLGRTTGTSFLDISNPAAPVYLGDLPSSTIASTWRGVKVYQDHAFIVSEATAHGLQIFDLTQLRSVATPPVRFTETAHYAGFAKAHTVAVNEDTGFLYAAGSNTCRGGLHMVDVRNPLSPAFAGCFSADGYTHETQCVVYHGPDARYGGREICFNANEDTLTVVDVTQKSAPVMVARKVYPGRGYAHQGWLTPDHRYFLLDDEKDETGLKTNTRTHVWDVSVLTAPGVIGIHEAATIAIDHNLYVHGTHAYQANYRSGLRVLDASAAADATLREIGFFDVHPEDDAPTYSGAWSNFPFFSSGVVLVSSIERGLFVVRPHLSALAGPDLIAQALTTPATAGAGMPLAVTYAIENQGGATARPSITRLHLSADAVLTSTDAVLGTYDIAELGSGIRDQHAVTVTVPPDTATGSYYLLATADADARVAEDIENNNVRPRFVRIGPDLRVTSLLVPSPAGAGSTIEVRDTTTNAGGGTAADVVTRLYLSRNSKIDTTDMEVGLHVVPALPPNGTHVATTRVAIPAGTAAGVYYILAHVDRDSELAETIENNNTAARQFVLQ